MLLPPRQTDLSLTSLFRISPQSNIFTRIVFLISCIASGMVVAKILRRQKEGEIALKKAREDAVKRETFLRALVRAIPDLVWLKDPQGVYLSCNSRFERFFGAKESEIVGKTDYDFVDRKTADAFRKRDQKAVSSKKACIHEDDLVFADDGHHERQETIKTPMYDDEGELMGVLGIGRDITERANLQAQLVQAQKMESIGRLAGGVAHDFNNMLSIILGNLEMILDDLPKDSHLVENLEEIKNATDRSSRLTKQLLAFARRQTISPKVIDLNDTVESILTMLRRLIGEDIDLAWHPGKNLWQVNVDPSQVDQILANLCVNSRDSIKNIGKVTIETGNLSLEAEDCRKHDGFIPGDYVMMTVSDTGSGMSKEILDHIFEPFYTTKGSGKGTGLGLAMVYGIMKQNKGFIYVYSEPGRGSIFRIYFPRHMGAGSGKSRPHPMDENPIGHETILLVEDELAILKVTKKRLEQLGYTVMGFSSPMEAIAFTDNSTRVHLLMTDVVMPEMNGRDLSKKLAKSHPGIKCLFMSGYTADVIAHHGLLDEGLNFISKPFSMRDLSLKLREILDGVGSR